MARKPIPAAAPVDAAINHEALAQAGRSATELVVLEEQQQEGLLALSVQLSYDGPLTIGALEDGIRFYQRRTVEACMELGKRLLLLKEVAGHGDFSRRVELLGVHERMARRFMSAALKFLKTDSKSVLEVAGNQTKLLELVVLDDDEIEQLNAGGSVGEITLDSIASMSTSELRNALREAKETAEAKDQVIAGQNDKIADQAEKLARPFRPKKSDPAKTAEEAAALEELTEATNGAEVTFARLAVVATELQGGNPVLRERAQQAVQYMVARIRQIVLENAIEVRVDDETLCGRPDWLGSAD